MAKTPGKSYIKIRKDEYLKLKQLQTRFAAFFGYIEHLRDIKEARKDISVGRVIPQEKLFQKLGL